MARAEQQHGLTCDGRGLVRLDDIPLFRLVCRNGRVMVVVRDASGMRAKMRGTDIVTVPLESFIAFVQQAAKDADAGRG